MAVQWTQLTDLNRLEPIWKSLSRHQTIYDDWNFRMCFYKYNQFPILGIVASENEQPVGLVILQNNLDKQCWEFFGGTYMEDNHILLAPGYDFLIPEFFEKIPKPHKLYSMIGSTPSITDLPLETHKYVLPLEGLTNFEDYLTRFLDAEARGKFRRKLRKVEREQLEVRLNHPEDMDTMITFNRAQFGDHSAFVARPHLTEIFHDLTKLGWPTHVYGFLHQGVPIAASFALVYNGVYEYFNLGTDERVEIDNLRDLATFVHKHNVEAAIAAGCHTFDAFTRSYGWKEHWRFTKIPQHELLSSNNPA